MLSDAARPATVGGPPVGYAGWLSRVWLSSRCAGLARRRHRRSDADCDAVLLCLIARKTDSRDAVTSRGAVP